MKVLLEAVEHSEWYRDLEVPALPLVGSLIWLKSEVYYDYTMWYVESIHYSERREQYVIWVTNGADMIVRNQKGGEEITDPEIILPLLGFRHGWEDM